jgi:REP element-mobilizing transposase RayT
MGRSLAKNYIHITFGTKLRENLIYPPYEDELYRYLAGICKAMDCHVLIVGGYMNHVHILCLLSKKYALMTLVEKLKANSSKWMKTKDVKLKDFQWQVGYGAFSIDYKSVPPVIKYIKNQKQHHRRKTFEEEFVQNLKEYNVEYDERYLWD